MINSYNPEFNGEEKREEGDRGDQEEKRGSQKGRQQSSQLSHPLVKMGTED